MLRAVRGDVARTVTAVLFGAYLILRALTSPDAYACRADLHLTWAAFIVYLVTAFILECAAVRNAIISVLLVFGVVHVAVSVVQAELAQNFALLIPSFSDVNRSARGAGLYADPDHLAGLLELVGILGLSVTCWSRWPHSLRVALAYFTGICYLGLALTGSRGGYLSAAVSLAVFGGLSFIVFRAGGSQRSLRYGSVGFALVAAAVAATSIFVHQTPVLQERAANTFTLDEGRLDIWRAALSQWKLNPLFGTGSGTFLFYGREFRPETLQGDPVDVHNDYLHLLCEYGAVGGVLFLVFLSAHLRAGVRTFNEFGPRRIESGTALRSNRLALSIGALCAVAAYAVHSLVDFNMHIPANALVVAVIFGILANSGDAALKQSRPRLASFPTRAAAVVLAVALLLQAIRLIPGEYFAEQAAAALRREYPATAIVFARKALKFEQRNPYIYLYLGRAFAAAANDKQYENSRTQLFERALSDFDKARRLAPLDGTYALEMARVYDALGRFEEAEWMFYLARLRDPRSTDVLGLYNVHLEAWQRSGQTTSR